MYFPDKGCVRPLRHLHGYAAGIPHQFNPRAYDPPLPPKIRPYNPQQGSCLEKDNARNDVRCTQARKTTHGLDGQHQDVDRTVRGRVNQNDTEDRDKWRKYVHDVATRIEDGFFFFGIHYMDSPDCLLLFLSISVFYF